MENYRHCLAPGVCGSDGKCAVCIAAKEALLAQVKPSVKPSVIVEDDDMAQMMIDFGGSE